MKKSLLSSFVVLCFSFVAQAENGKPLKKTLFPAAESSVDTVRKAKPQFGVANAFTNSYCWRGLTFNEGLMFQPSATVSYENLFFNSWSNVVAQETAGNKFVPQMNFTLGYKFEKSNWTVLPQANMFFYPSNSSDVATVEIGAEIFYDLQNVGLYCNPNLDVANNRGGFYVDYGLCKSGILNERWTYDTKFLLGWGNKTFTKYYKPVVEVETNANPTLLQPEAMKAMRLQGSANYQATRHLSVQPQLTVFRNFMTEYTFQQNALQVNASLTCAYTF